MKKTALITGITGQDGSYLAKLLLEKGYRVIGVTRSYSGVNIKNLAYLGIDKEVVIEECDMYDIVGIINLIREYKPSHIYNLAAQSSVRVSFEQPIGTIKYNIESVLNLLEAIRLTDTSIRFYQASSSEMYGNVDSLPVSLATHLNPVSPYAVSKASAFMLVNNYRNAYHLFAVNGVLFNHESYLRTSNFFVKKVIVESIRIKQGLAQELRVGNIDIKRDFGYAPKYVEAMYLAMVRNTPADYLVCSGVSVSLRDIIYHIFNKLGIDKNKLVIDPELYRPDDIDNLYGNNTETKTSLQWEYHIDFFSVLDLLLEEELRNQ
jgi:GDPmannose 4,6-dehydratase